MATKKLLVSLPEEVYFAMEKRAERDSRSKSGYIRHLLMKDLNFKEK
jgi:hypothetical protein